MADNYNYYINQYQQKADEEVGVEHSAYFTDFLKTKASTIETSLDINVSAIDEQDFIFTEQCLKLDDGFFQIENNYFLHTKIKRLSSAQTFDVYLINGDDTNNFNECEKQFIKKITIKNSDKENSWVDFSCIFSPLKSNFNTIVFKLARTVEDFTKIRVPIIVYEELCVIKNMLNDRDMISAENLIKIGVQSHPGALLCINGEEITVGKTGIYELRPGNILIDFLGYVVPTIYNIDLNTFSESISIFDDTNFDFSYIRGTSNRIINPTLIDYIYKEKKGGRK